MLAVLVSYLTVAVCLGLALVGIEGFGDDLSAVAYSDVLEQRRRSWSNLLSRVRARFDARTAKMLA